MQAHRLTGTSTSQLLYAATIKALSQLGDLNMRALVWQMNMDGVCITPENFDVRILAAELRILFGTASEAILERIYQEFSSTFEAGRLRPAAKQYKAVSALRKIEQIIELGA